MASFSLALSSFALLPQQPLRRTDVLSGGVAAVLIPARVASGKEYPHTVEWEKLPFLLRRQGGAEPPNTSPLVGEQRNGVYECAACHTALFSSAAKFSAGDGSTSFASALDGVETGGHWWAAQLHLSNEVHCAGCGGHLGDLFNDGAAFTGTRAEATGTRFCCDGAALVFLPADGSEPVSGDGLTQRRTESPSILLSHPTLRLPRTAGRRSSTPMMAAEEDDARTDDGGIDGGRMSFRSSGRRIGGGRRVGRSDDARAMELPLGKFAAAIAVLLLGKSLLFAPMPDFSYSVSSYSLTTVRTGDDGSGVPKYETRTESSFKTNVPGLAERVAEQRQTQVQCNPIGCSSRSDRLSREAPP